MLRSHRSSILIAFGISAMLLFAGCMDIVQEDDGPPLDGSDDQDRPEDGNGPSMQPPGSGGGSSGGSGVGTGNGNGNGNGTGTGNGTGNETNGNGPGNGTVEEHDWPPIQQATIRPGMRLYVDRITGSDGFCTANFVFRSPTNGTFYIGTAAHCMYQDVGAKVYTSPEFGYVMGGRGDYIGKVVYSSYAVLGTEEQGSAHTEINDFALIEIDPEVIDKVHPAMLHYGGPTGLAEVSDLAFLKKVIYFGNSPTRPGPDPVKWHEGYIRDITAPWAFRAYTVGPGIPGDSGSGVLLASGEAAGITVAIALAPFPAESTMTTLATALSFAADHGWDVELQTWELLTSGYLPN
jgi:hypothetical protein